MMGLSLCTLLAVTTAGGAAPSTGERLARLLVMPLEARAGVSAKEASLLSDLLVSETRRIPGYRVIAHADIEQMLSLEMKQQLLGCNGTSCLAELGGALDADEVLYGSVGRLGREELVLSVTRIDPRNANALAGESERLSGANADATLDSVPRVLHRLYPQYEPPEPRVRTLSRPLLWGALTAAGAAIQYSAFSSLFTSVVFWPCPPLMVVSMVCSSLMCFSGPFYVSAAQTWLADVMGRRQAGFRKPALAGALGLMFTAMYTLGAVITGSVLAALTGVVLVAFLDGWPEAWRLQPLHSWATLDNWHRAWLAPDRFFILGAALGLLPGVLALVTLIPGAQAVVLLAISQERPKDADPARPGLWGPFEEPPGFLHFLPRKLLGGPQNTLDLAELEEAVK
ncbi:MAG: hypothetical protein AB2A00_27380, partial [Myxococcota bacterium]